jgi:hypothetical protein
MGWTEKHARNEENYTMISKLILEKSSAKESAGFEFIIKRNIIIETVINLRAAQKHTISLPVL